ncbi:MAG: type II toxin-antitoxin system VapC family toxin [Verrucomicrobia bacterium]|nr:MAG: type II toxin-antitoxin system VapC family toxin [Verrucomicrobiota bacterium]
MKVALDSTVIIAALNEAEPSHNACRKLLLSGEAHIHGHAFSETFCILTGGRLGIRVSAADAAALLREQVAPRVKVINLTATELLDSYAEAPDRGIRGGAIYDYLHLVAARKAGVAKFFTLNVNDFKSFQRPGDPGIVHP